MKLSVISAVLLSLVFAYAEPTTPAEEKTNPEIEKIDKRLEELKTIWRQEQAIINGYTKNRTVPVKEGSREYHACVKASNRTKQAEEEAAILKQRRLLLSGEANLAPTIDGKGSDELTAAVKTATEAWSFSLNEEYERKSGRAIKKPDTEEELIKAASDAFLHLNPSEFIHPLEKQSPTLSFLSASVNLQGPELKEIQGLFDSQDWRGLIHHLTKSEEDTALTLELVKTAIRLLENKKFYVKLVPQNPTFLSLNGLSQKVSLIPKAVPALNREYFANQLTAYSEFKPHPDGPSAGYLLEWSPSDGPLLLLLPYTPATIGEIKRAQQRFQASTARTPDQFDWSSTAQQLHELRNKLLDSRSSGESNDHRSKVGKMNSANQLELSNLNEKIKIGDLTREEADTLYLQKKAYMYQSLLTYLRQW